MTVLSQWWWLPLLGLVLHYITRTVVRRQRPKNAKKPPGPKGWPFVGNALALGSANSTDMIHIFRKWAEEYGPITQISLMGAKQVILSDEKIANELFVKRGNRYSNRGAPHAVQYISMKQSPGFRDKDEGWRRQRKMLHSAVSIAAISKYQSLMDDEATFSLSALIQSPLSFHSEFLRYAYSVLTSSMLGFSITSSSDPFIRDNESFTAEIMDSFRPDCFPSNVFPILQQFPNWLVPSLQKMERLRKEYVGQMWSLRRKIQASIEDGSAKDSIYKHFLLNRGDCNVSDEESVHVFQAMIDGGTRSPHNNLITLLFLMIKYPEWQTKLQEEIDKVVGNVRMPSYQDIHKLPTVRAIVKEGVRYRSIMAEMGISHCSEEDDIYDGYAFEKGTVFHATFASILTDGNIYPDGNLFNPARWLEPDYPTYKEPLTVYPTCQGYPAFGYGRRACPGVDFAERSLVIMLAKLGWAVNIHWPLDKDGKEIRKALEYEPVPAPRPLRFDCRIEPRDPERVRIIQMAAERLKMN